MKVVPYCSVPAERMGFTYAFSSCFHTLSSLDRTMDRHVPQTKTVTCFLLRLCSERHGNHSPEGVDFGSQICFVWPVTMFKEIELIVNIKKWEISHKNPDFRLLFKQWEDLAEWSPIPAWRQWLEQRSLLSHTPACPLRLHSSHHPLVKPGHGCASAVSLLRWGCSGK